jgi:omega-6 fatty acid desaturase (delta-12 desaturase)
MQTANTEGWRHTREELKPYSDASWGKAILDLATSVVPYLGLTALMFVLALDLKINVLGILGIGVLAAGFLLRTYIVFHDCAHNSFLPSRRGNTWLGTFVGLIVYSPFQAWRFDHSVHHATAGDLDKRGVGDVETMTLDEYLEASLLRRAAYRAFRNPLVMFTIGPLWALLIMPRLVPAGTRPRNRNSILLTNVAVVGMLTAGCLIFGIEAFLLVWGPSVLMAGAAGVWLFYVQHQFEDTYWESGDRWSYGDAALRGSSYLKLPQPFQWFTGNIGLHHVHHLCHKIPNYNLQAAHDGTPVLHTVPVLSAWDGVKACRLKVWDEGSKRLLTWAQVRQLTAAQPVAAGI